MKKMKGGLDREAIKGFFIHHGEKVGFGVAVFLVALFFYMGYGTSALETELDPKMLNELADRKSQSINNSSWDSYVDYRTVDENPDTTDRIVENNWLVDILAENPPPRKEPRLDPDLKAPTDAMAVGQYITLAINRNDYVNAVDRLEYYSEDEPRRRRRDDDDDDDSNSPYDDDDPYGGSGDDGPGAGGPGAGGPGQDGPGAGGPGAGGPGGGTIGMEDFMTIPDVMRRELQGVAALPVYSGQSTRLYGPYAISVTAVVPYENQWNEYDLKFKSSLGYSPARDYPDYVYLEVQRRTDGGEWMDISDRVRSYASDYVVVTPEIADPEYTDPTLTLPLPPVMVGNFDRLALHPRVERVSFGDDDEGTEEASDDEDNFLDGGSGSSTGDSSRDDGGYPSGDGGYPDGGNDDGNPYGGGDSGNPYGGGSLFSETGPERDDVPVKLIRLTDLSTTMGETYEYRVRVWLSDVNDPDGGKNQSDPYGGGGGDGPGAGGPGAGGPGAGGPGAGGPGAGGPGAGGPGSGGGTTGRKVTMTMLHPSVRTRLREWKESDEYKALEADDPRRHARPTEWSNITNSISVPKPRVEHFAGPVNTTPSSSFENIRFQVSEINANLAIRVWDPKLFTSVPDAREVRRGDFLTYTGDRVSMLNPRDLSLRMAGVRKVDNPEDEDERETTYLMKADTIVLDIVGGDRLPGDRKYEFNTFSEMLLFDMDGNFIVTHEFMDAQQYRHSLFMEDDELTDGRRRRRDEDDDDTGSPFGSGGNPYGGSGGNPYGGSGGR